MLNPGVVIVLIIKSTCKHSFAFFYPFIPTWYKSFYLLSDKLIQTFEKLGFIIIPKDNLTDKDMIREMKMMSLKDHSAYDCFVCCILTHGVLGSLYGINGITTPIRDLTGPMRAQSCPTLAGKPKLFFMQACQGREKQTGEFIICLLC